MPNLWSWTNSRRYFWWWARASRIIGTHIVHLINFHWVSFCYVHCLPRYFLGDHNLFWKLYVLSSIKSISYWICWMISKPTFYRLVYDYHIYSLSPTCSNSSLVVLSCPWKAINIVVSKMFNLWSLWLVSRIRTQMKSWPEDWLYIYIYIYLMLSK